MAKLRPGMREKNGSIEYRFMVNGKRHSVCAKTVRECLEKETALRAKLAENGYRNNSTITIGQYFPEWIERKALIVKTGTIAAYTSAYNNNIKGSAIDNKRIIDLERREIINYMSAVAEKKTVNTANNTLRVIQCILNDAVRDGIISKSPAYLIKKLPTDKRHASETIHRALTREEQRLFVEELKDDWYEGAMMLQLLTGMRGGEVCALRWDDIDAEHNVIHVRRTTAYDKNYDRVENTPKTRASVRDIPMNSDIRACLARQRQIQAFSKVSDIEGHVFLNKRGTPAYTSLLSFGMKRVLERLEKKGVHIEHISDHAMRDTFATRYIEAGGSMQTLKTILGHSSLMITMDLYAHVLPDTKQSEMDRIKII